MRFFFFANINIIFVLLFTEIKNVEVKESRVSKKNKIIQCVGIYDLFILPNYINFLK
jgi:hypothetical protein